MSNIRSMISQYEMVFTETEQKIADYILKHSNEIINDNSGELAKKIGVGQSSIIKFISKVGFNGFNSFKAMLIAENIVNDDGYFHGDISLSNSLEQVGNAISLESITTIKDTMQNIDYDLIEKVIDSICSSNRIYIFGKGSSSLPALDLSSKLMKIGLPAVYYSDLDSIKAAALCTNKSEIFIAFTFSGETKEIIDIQKLAKSNNATLVTITKNINSESGKLSDMNLKIISNETLIRTAAMSSIMAFLSIVNVLFLGLIKKDLNNSLNKINYLSASSRK